MSDIWVWWIYDLELGGDPSATPIERVDVTGFHVEAIDGRIGTVDAATYEGGRGDLVVDTGFWIFGTKRMIPAGLISRIDADERVVHLGVAKEHVKDAPDYDAARADEATYREHVGGHYDAMRGDTIGPTAGTGRGPGELTGDPIAPVAGGSSRPQPT